MFAGPPTATSARLTAPQPVSPGVYRISVVVTDSEGRRCEAPESLTLEVCECDYRDVCQSVYPTNVPDTRIGERSGRMGAAAIGLLFLGLLLLLCEYPRALSGRHRDGGMWVDKASLQLFQRQSSRGDVGAGGALTFSGRTRNVSS